MRVGIIGFGAIGRYVYERMAQAPELGLAPSFIWNRSPAALQDLPPDLILDDLSTARDAAPDLIVEVAHPQISHDHGKDFLTYADYMPLSVSALADPALERALTEAASASGQRLLIPHGALVGTDNLVEGRDNWETVTITFEKNPGSIDFSECALEPNATERTVVFDGTAREIGRLFPRNVNTMVTCGLATIGLDRCRAVLISDPALEAAILDVQAAGKDGAHLHVRKEQPMMGVSGTEMLGALFGSVERAAGSRAGLQFV